MIIPASVTVCIATYNGEKYLLEQITSILEQLNAEDEVVIVDDCSNDNTLNILMMLDDPRVKIVLNDQNMGHVYSFGRAISLANNDIIFLADQDDRWIKGRVLIMKDVLLNSGLLLVSTNSDFMNANGVMTLYPADGVKANDSSKYFKNIVGIFMGNKSYYGCAMAFRKQLVPFILPIPQYVESHDLWIAMVANMISSNVHIEIATLVRRIHNNNASIIQRPIFLKIWSRIIFAISFFDILVRVKAVRP